MDNSKSFKSLVNNVITTEAALPSYSSVLDDSFFSADLPANYKDFLVCLVSSSDHHKVFFLITERALDSGIAASAFYNFDQELYSFEVLVSTIEFIKLIRQKELSNNDVGVIEQVASEKRFHRLIQNALDLRASDIHFQINEDNADILFRINGELFKKDSGTSEDFKLFLETHYTSFSSDHQNPGYSSKFPLSSTAKGNFILNKPYINLKDSDFESHEVTVKVRKQSLPLANSNSDEVWRLIVIDKTTRLPDFFELGYMDHQVEVLLRNIRKPKGLILFCGSTGSGKSVSNASCLSKLVDIYKGRRSIRSAENPVEMEIPGVRQWSISDSSGYHEVLKVYMRSDPDIISVGEIIDNESALAAANASLSGHLTFSTLHGATPKKVFKRLEQFGIDRLTLAEDGFINLIVIQTLVKTLCSHCKLPFKDSFEYEVDDSFLNNELAHVKDVPLFGNGGGCIHCNDTGYVTRTVIANVCEITNEMRFLFEQDKINEAFKLNKDSILKSALNLMYSGKVSPVSVLDECGTLSLENFL